jgi:hypothetical protein
MGPVINSGRDGNTAGMNNTQESQYEIDGVTYLVERVFSGDKTPGQIVVEEIITAAARADFFDGPGAKMV